MIERAKSDYVTVGVHRRDGISPGGPDSVRRDVITRWGGNPLLARNGFVPVVRTFLWHAARVGLSPVETLLVIHLMGHKWSDEHPHPSYRKLAQHLGISLVYCRKLIRGLEARGFLQREPVKGGNSAFDLSPLFFKLALAVEQRDRFVEMGAPNEGVSPSVKKKTRRRAPTG